MALSTLHSVHKTNEAMLPLYYAVSTIRGTTTMKALPLLLSQILMVFVISSASNHAFSQELPNYDFDTQCRKSSAVKRGLPDKVLEECLTRQNDFYTAAKAEWTSLPANVKKDCGDVAVSNGSGSYGLLETCIMQYISGTK